MDFSTVLRLLRKGWALVAVGAALGLGVGIGITMIATPTYSATTGLYVSVTGATTSAELAQGGSAAEQKVQTFANVARSARVLQPVIDELGLGGSTTDLAERVSAQTPIDSVLVNVTVTDESARDAADIANAVGKSLATVVTSELELPSPDGTSPFRIETIQPALAPTSPSSPMLSANALGGGIVGLLLGFAFAALRAALDTRVESRDEAESITGVPAIGEIAFDKAVRERPLIVHDDPASARSEAFRRLRTNLQFLELGRASRSFVVTSSVPSEGKSTTASNLAIALAETGARVVLVDGDLRRPRIADIMGVVGEAGITDVLIGRLELDDALQAWGRAGLSVLPSGQIPPNPAELLGSDVMTAVVRELESSFDVVIIDSPPLLPVTDAAILGKVAGGALLVTAMHRTTRRQLAGARAVLADAGGTALGVVLTMARASRVSAYTYGYRPVPPVARRCDDGDDGGRHSGHDSDHAVVPVR